MSLDDNGNNIGDYYVFSGVEKAGKDKDKEIKDFAEFLSILTNKRHVILEGEDSSGKTTLLKQLYLSLVGSYVPIYLNVDSIVNKNPEKILKSAFETQYGANEFDFEKYRQIDKEKKIILIDDLGKIKPKYIEPLQNYLFENVGHVVSVVEAQCVINFLDQIKEKYNSGDIVKLQILPFYTEKRLELIKKNLICLN